MTFETCSIPLAHDAHGAIRVEGTRITLEAIVFAFREGATAEEIAERFPAISLSAIYAAIAFYLQNGPEVDAYLLRREAEAAKLQTEIETRLDVGSLRKRLLSRKLSSESN